MRNKIFSPLSPQREKQGAKAAIRYYQIMHSYSSKQVIESANRLYWHFCKTQGYEFASGFRDWSLFIAITRLGRSEIGP